MQLQSSSEARHYRLAHERARFRLLSTSYNSFNEVELATAMPIQAHWQVMLCAPCFSP
jgi:hypothetical protein